MNKNKQMLVLGIILILVALLLIGAAFVITNDDKKPIIDNNEEELANSILTSLNIDDYLEYVLRPDVVVDNNILDMTNNQYKFLYLYANDNLVKARLEAYDTGYAYAIVKYTSYVKEMRRVFGDDVELEFVSASERPASIVFGVNNLPDKFDENFTVKTGDIVSCNMDKPDNCFVMLIQEVSDDRRAEFSNLKINGDTITGDVKAFTKADDSEIFIDGSFEFEYEKKDANYIAKSLVIKSVSDAYNGV